MNNRALASRPEMIKIRPASFVGIYFEYNEVTKRSKCMVPDCSISLAGRHTSNLEKHIIRNHAAEAAVITAERLKLKAQKELYKQGTSNSEISEISIDETLSRTHSSGESSTTSNRKKQKNTIMIHMDRQRLLDACVELVTVNGRPFSIVEDSGMKKILNPILHAMEGNVAINRHNVRDSVLQEARIIREEIRKEVKESLISLKVDTASRLDRSLIGVNIQFSRNGKIILRNLAVKELYTRHTAENLKDEILQILREFSITPTMLYSITTDNAANMLKTVKLLEVDAHSDMSSAGEDEDEGDDDEMSDNEIPDVIHDEEEHLMKTINLLPTYFHDESIFSQRCAAHTLQLAIIDALKQTETDGILNETRKLCKLLRTPTVTGILYRLGRKKPILDCATRWHSTLDMVNSLLELKDICHEVMREKEKTTLSEGEWERLTIISKSLTPAKIATKKLQSEQLLMGDFIEIWLTCKLNIKAVGSTLALAVYTAMEKREQLLFQTPTILCAIYMDPRWHVILSQEQRSAAINYLHSIWRRLEALKSKMQEAAPAENTTNLNTEDEMIGLELEEDPLESMLRRKEVALIGSDRMTVEDIKTKIQEFSKTPRIPRCENILMYWEKKKLTDPDLYQIARTVLAVPATQVSVERTFSNLKFILSYLRSKMQPAVVNDVLLVRCNRIFQKHEKN